MSSRVEVAGERAEDESEETAEAGMVESEESRAGDETDKEGGNGEGDGEDRNGEEETEAEDEEEVDNRVD
jgi:hypothetical protein